MPIGPPVTDAQGPAVTTGVILTNAGSDPVNYSVNQQPFAMEPRYTQNLKAGQSWLVEFDRGGSQGMARYQLEDGAYEFTPTPNGWELYKQSYRVTLDNSGNDSDFQYIVDNQQQTLPAGQSHELSGAFPPAVRFDNGAGVHKGI